MRSHDRIDCIEKELMRKFHAIACIHMDPVDTEDERVETLPPARRGCFEGYR